jgi:hypothetical protein
VPSGVVRAYEVAMQRPSRRVEGGLLARRAQVIGLEMCLPTLARMPGLCCELCQQARRFPRRVGKGSQPRFPFTLRERFTAITPSNLVASRACCSPPYVQIS